MITIERNMVAWVAALVKGRGKTEGEGLYNAPSLPSFLPSSLRAAAQARNMLV